MAAGLVAMAARLAHEWPKATEVIERAEVLRSQMATLALADEDAYAKVIEALRLPPESPARPAQLEAALSDAANVPLAIAEAAAEVAMLAALVAQEGNERLRGDALVAAELAKAGARGAAELVAINLAGRDDPRIGRARDLAAATQRER
jgi:formiminotetrahydrofolate cyclodeaminase